VTGSVYSTVALVLAATFALIGAVQLIGPEFVRNAYRRWNYSTRLRIVTGMLDIAAAFMLAAPEMRAWGIGLAALLSFGSVVILINHRHYFSALAASALMAALVPAALAVPREAQVQFVVRKEVARQPGVMALDGEEQTDEPARVIESSFLEPPG